MAYPKASGQITVTTAGTEVRGSNVVSLGGFMVRALSTNTGKMYIGNAGNDTVSSSTGYELSAGDQIFIDVENLNEILVDSSVNGEKVCWFAVKPRSL